MLQIPGYHLTAQIYESANSLVYRGYRSADRQPVILKLLKQDYPSPEELTRYHQEYDIIRSLQLAGVIQTYGLYPYQNTLVIVLEDFGAESLAYWIKCRSFSLEEVLTLGIQITQSLGEVHQQQIIHKDLNPANMVWNPETGQLKLIDFGISTRISRENPTLRNPNRLEGTLAYLSPEQTGRMNRSLDYRTDFYSLGVTLYELLVGELPCTATDALELVHCHIARQPIAPHDRRPAIPPTVSDLVMKLMAKTAEDRYQSCRGIQTDLEICLAQLRTTGTIVPFRLGQQDSSDKFQIPQKLYGRDREIAELLTAFDRVTQTGTALMLVSGYSGVGKTSLVQEIYKPITQQRGHFIAGKFDQYQRDIPYTALVAAFKSLINQLLAESQAQLNYWRDRLLAALGANAQVMVEVVPELKLILGAQPAVPELPPAEARNRFNQVLQKFIQAVAQPSHPLVIFLDDLQWADLASLQLLPVLMTADQLPLFLIGAYRNNEVSATHPLVQILETMRQDGMAISEIVLTPLQLVDIQHLLSDTLHRSSQAVQPLAELVLAKTNGNPFFVNEFLKALCVEGWLTFDYQRAEWSWAIDQIQRQGITDNVVELMISKIQRLQPTTQQVLRQAACVGNRFDVQTLTAVLALLGTFSSYDSAQTIASLQEAVNEGLVMPLGEQYRQVAYGIPEPDEGAKVDYQFVHDRIQQAAYSLNTEVDRIQTHRHIGQHLLQHLSPEQPARQLFDLVNHLNLSRSLLNSPAEQDELIQLNLRAGQKAKASAAYDAAFRYLQISLTLLALHSWETDYEPTLTLYNTAAEVAYLSGHFEEADRWSQQIVDQARTLLDTIKAYDVKIQTQVAQGNLLTAIHLGLEVLTQLGVALPEKPTPEDFQAILAETKIILVDRSPETLLTAPLMTNPQALAAMQLLTSMCAAAFLATPALFPLTVFKMVELLVKHGNMLLAPFAYGAYGLILCGVVLEIEAGYQFGQLALALLERLDARAIAARTLFPVNDQINVWKLHIRHSLQPLQDCYQSGIDQGDLEFAGYAAMHVCAYAFVVGQPLAEVQQQAANYDQAVRRIKHFPSSSFIRMGWQTVLNLVKETTDPGQLSGGVFDEAIDLPPLQTTNFAGGLFYFHLNKLQLCYLFNQIEEAVAQANLTEPYLPAMTGAALVAIFRFYDSLARLALYPATSRTKQTAILDKVATNQTLMKRWADHAPMNYLHKWYLVEAERHRVLGETLAAMDAYDRAIELAKEHGYIQEKALANELAAKLHLDRGQETVARAYLQEAHYCYLKWGATAKAKALEHHYPQLLGKAKSHQGMVGQPIPSFTTASDTSEGLDLATVLKASRVLAGELNLQNLLTQLLTLALENAGAQVGSLLLAQGQQLCLVASGGVAPGEIRVQASIPLEDWTELPHSLIQYVARTQETVVLDEATQHITFIQDPYIQRYQPRSLLCTPIQGQGKLTGILYLENDLTSGAFTVDRVAILRVLTAQAAIALENAQLYEQLANYSQTLETNNQVLEQEVSERKRAEAQLSASLAEKEVLIQEIHHRVKNNLQVISGLLQLQLQGIDNPQAANLLQESCNRIEAMSLIHKKLYFSTDLGQIEMADYLTSLASSLMMVYQVSPTTISLQTDLASIVLNIDQAIPCGLIVNELISNALKHAFPDEYKGMIQMSLGRTEQGDIELRIQDNGIGLPEEVDWRYTQSLGLSLVRDLAIDQLEGTIEVMAEEGTTFQIAFPQLVL